jgi:hypothetical protein
MAKMSSMAKIEEPLTGDGAAPLHPTRVHWLRGKSAALSTVAPAESPDRGARAFQGPPGTDIYARMTGRMAQAL